MAEIPLIGGNGHKERAKCSFPKCSRWAGPSAEGGFCVEHMERFEEIIHYLGFLKVDDVPLMLILKAGAMAMKRNALIIPRGSIVPHVPKER